MGVMDKFLNYMKLNDEEDEGFYDDDYLDDEEEVEPVKKFGAAKNRQQDHITTDDKNMFHISRLHTVINDRCHQERNHHFHGYFQDHEYGCDKGCTLIFLDLSG